MTWLRILPLSKNISKFYKQKARKTSETQQLISIYAELIIKCNSCTKCLLNNRQPYALKAVKFSLNLSLQNWKKCNRQQSKLRAKGRSQIENSKRITKLTSSPNILTGQKRDFTERKFLQWPAIVPDHRPKITLSPGVT